jgi:hypothetical protein
MLNMVGGDPPNQVLVLGLSFNNLDKFEKYPNDTYIRVTSEVTKLPLDVIIGSGDSFQMKSNENGREVFVVSLGMAELRRLRRQPLKFFIELKREFYKLPMSICIFSGETEAVMADHLQEFVGPNTHVTMDNRLKN